MAAHLKGQRYQVPAFMHWDLQIAKVDTQGRWLEPCLEGESYIQENLFGK